MAMVLHPEHLEDSLFRFNGEL